MGIDTFTELNAGAGGSFMDETEVTYLVAPLERRRERVHIAGCLAEELTEVLNAEPAVDDYGLVVRNIPTGTQTVEDYDRDSTVKQYTLISSSSAETTILTAGGASIFNDISSITVSTDKTCFVTIRDATAGSTVMVFSIHATNEPHIHMTFDPPLKQAAVNNNWTAQLSVSNADVTFTVAAVEKT
jgi:hypothetical protein